MHPDATLGILQDIGRLELALADFYATVAALRPADAVFWKSLEDEERRHAAHVEHLGALIAENRDRFQDNRAFNATAIQSFLAYVQATTRRLQGGEIDPADESRLLALARDMEQSVIEGKYNEIVKTADKRFQAVIRQIVADTVAHKGKIAGRLSQSMGRAK